MTTQKQNQRRIETQFTLFPQHLSINISRFQDSKAKARTRVAERLQTHVIIQASLFLA